MLGVYPDYGKAPASYLLAVTEFMAGLSPEEQSQITDLKTGIPARCKFLPTIADMAEILNERRSALEQFRPAHTVYRKLGPDHGPWDQETDFERKKRVVRECLGYNPGDSIGKTKPAFESLPLDKLQSSADCKTPSRPISRELRQMLTDDGWPYFADMAEPQP